MRVQTTLTASVKKKKKITTPTCTQFVESGCDNCRQFEDQEEAAEFTSPHFTGYACGCVCVCVALC